MVKSIVARVGELSGLRPGAAVGDQPRPDAGAIGIPAWIRRQGNSRPRVTNVRRRNS